MVDTGATRGIQGGIGGGVDARWATVYARVGDVEQTLSHVETLGGSRISAPGAIALKSAARAALYEPMDYASLDDTLKMATFRDPAGNVFGIYNH